MSSMKKKASSIFMFGALAALLTGGCMAEVGEESTANEEGIESTEEALTSEEGASTEAFEAGDDSSTEVIRRRRRSGDLCEQFCQAEYLDCMGFGPRAGAYGHRLPGHLGESPCHKRLRRCMRMCYYEGSY